MIETQAPQSAICPSCKVPKPRTEEYWYKARPREGHKKEGWQSYCRACWPTINRNNKRKRKMVKAVITVEVK